MSYFHLIQVNLTRKKTRLVLTIGSFAVALFLFGLLMAIDNAFYGGVAAASANRLITRNKTSLVMFLPYAHKQKILQVPGVADAVASFWFGGVYQEPKNFFPQFAIEENYLEIFPEYKINPEEWAAFLKDRQGCVVGKGLAAKFGWRVGDRIPLQGTIFPGIWEFNLCGIYDGTREQDDVKQFWFHTKYITERSPFADGQAGWFTIKLNEPERAFEIATAIDALFANSPNQTKTEPQSMFEAGFVKQFGNIRFILTAVGTVVLITLLLVTGSTLAMAVRERTGEIGILKTLGFSDVQVLLLVLGESLTYALSGGGLGLAGVKWLTMRGDPTGGFLQQFYLSTENLLTGVAIVVVVGFLAGIFPAWQAMRLRVVEALRRV